MSESTSFNPRKRRRSRPVQLKNSPLPAPKRQRAVYDCRPQTSLGYWDNVSKVWLVKGALKELDRRNCQFRPSLRPALQQACRPIVRSATKAIENIARNGGPDLSDLRNYPDPSRSSYRTMNSYKPSFQSQGVGSAATQSSEPYNRQFEQILTDNHVYPSRYRYPDRRPNNWNDINDRLAYPRPSLSPSKFGDEDFDNFDEADTKASKDKHLCESVIPVIEGKITDPRCRSGGVPFRNLASLTDRPLTNANPDVYYGARPEQLHRGIRDAIGHHVVPLTENSLPLAPNFFFKAKGPESSVAVAERHACYNGALGARAMHALQMYGQETPTYDNNAYTISSSYYGGLLKLYTSHIGAPCSAGGQSEIYMTQLRTYVMTNSVEDFRSGAAAYRNARDYAKEQRDRAILQANGQWHRMHETPADDMVSSPALSFVTEEEPTETYSITQPTMPLTNNLNSDIESNS